ncbi:MAG: CRISPR-associated protein Cas4 [Methanomicrobiales archaeon]
MNKIEVLKIISVSSISEYIYCPMKLYLRHSLEEAPKTKQMIGGKINHDIKQEFQELIKRDFWLIKKEMEIKEIFNIIYNNIFPLLERSLKNYPDLEHLEKSDIQNIFKKLINQLKVESCFMALKIKNYMDVNEKDANQIMEQIFPPTIMEYKIEDRDIGIRGIIDKIEVFEGIYYPVEFKSGKAPIKGVWESDKLQIAAYGVLIEKEFDTEVLVGFVEYLNIKERRPVVLNSKLRKKLFNTIKEMNGMFYENIVPELDLNFNKCQICDYSDYCEYFHKPSP